MQVYYSVMTKYAPKRTQFSAEGMEARTQLAALDNNCNVGRGQAQTKQGEARIHVNVKVPDVCIAYNMYAALV